MILSVVTLKFPVLVTKTLFFGGGGKLYFGLQITVHHERKSVQELEAGIWSRNLSRDHGGTLLAGLFSVVLPACFLT